MSTYINLIMLLSLLLASLLSYILLLFYKRKIFDKYFQIHLEETYNLEDLFQIKIRGLIIPKVDFLDIPYENLNIEIDTKIIRGTIINNRVSIELIRPKDRNNALYLIKNNYIRTVKPYILETLKNKKDYIRLIKLSKKQKPYMEKIACQTCKHRVQCQIAFTKCNYERETEDKILRKGIKVNTDRNYKLDDLN